MTPEPRPDELTDPELIAEINLLAEVMLVAGSADGPLSAADVDGALGLEAA